MQAFYVTLCYRLTPEHDIIERWLELENAGQDTVSFEVCNFASLHIPNGTNELTYVTGTWAREFKARRPDLSPDGKKIAWGADDCVLKVGDLALVDGKWLVRDVRIDGVSIIENYQKSFSRMIKQESFDALLKKMRVQQQAIGK